MVPIQQPVDAATPIGSVQQSTASSDPPATGVGTCLPTKAIQGTYSLSIFHGSLNSTKIRLALVMLLNDG